MSHKKLNLNPEVTRFLDEQEHPFRKEIEELRLLILSAKPGLTENIKWNGPNYCYNNCDRITMRIQPPKQVQLIFHRGAKALSQPAERLIHDDTGLLQWKENDRAVATFKSWDHLESNKPAVQKIINDWIVASL